MLATPPIEILEHIIDWVACDTDASRIHDLLSLSICCKALVPRSQKHIFRDVTLYPPLDRAREVRLGPLVWSKHYERTALFTQTVAGKTHLGGHVQTLTIKFTGELLSAEATISSNVPYVFMYMGNIRRLTLAHSQSNIRLDFGSLSVRTSAWAKGIASLLQHSQVQELSVDGLKTFPGEAVVCSSHLRHLDLLNCHIQFNELVYVAVSYIITSPPHSPTLVMIYQHFFAKPLACDR